jgi:hypothetical protein
VTHREARARADALLDLCGDGDILLRRAEIEALLAEVDRMAGEIAEYRERDRLRAQRDAAASALRKRPRR